MIKFLIAFVIFFSQLVSAEIINQVKVIGNERISSETIKVYGGIKINSNYEKSDVDQILKKLYATEFFEEINISLSNGVLKLM